MGVKSEDSDDRCEKCLGRAIIVYTHGFITCSGCGGSGKKRPIKKKEKDD